MKAKTKRKVGRNKVVRKPATPKLKVKAAKAKTNGRPKARAAPRPKLSRARTGRAARPRRTPAASSSRWVSFVAKHGVVLASAKGPIPNVAEAVAGEPIVGSWWAHKKGKAIFAALCEIDDSTDVRCFKLVDGKVTFAHRKTWPALVRLGHDGVLSAEQLSSVQQEHMPTGEHRNIVTPFPAWVDEATAAAAARLASDAARAQLAWIDAR